MGHPAVLVTTPGHIFAALSTGLPAQSGTAVTFDEDALLTHGGTLWVPVETTLVDKTFPEAWKGGATELARWKAEPDKVRVIDVRAAWATYPTVDLASAAGSVREVSAEVLASEVSTSVGAADHTRNEYLAARLTEIDQRIAEAGERPELLNKKGQVLFHQGAKAEARGLFERASKDARWGKLARNNLGNLHMVAGRAEEALATYRSAAELDDGDARVQLNAALAAFSAGDEDAFGEHIFNCIDLGAEESVTQLSQSGFGVAPGTTGADGDGIAMRELQRSLQKAFKRAGREMPAAAKPSKTTASDAAGSGVPVHRYLYWL
ncbi:MAG: tetratricopeptide repeat protein [Myxococcota bacterium]|nr:tetratricopeptide repeat protein [Myxococcota bacterium]